MGKSAAELYGKDPDKVTADGLRVDMILEDADIINLGDEKIAAFGTKGHTDCSVSYFMQPGGILFANYVLPLILSL